MKKKFFLLLIFISIFSGCESNPDEISTQEELLEIVNIQVPESGGVKLEATYTGPASIQPLETGFLISRSQFLSAQNSTNVPGTTLGNNTSGEYYNDLIYNEQYYVIAYIKYDNGRILYSEIKNFVSLGSKLPMITGMNRAVILDTVTIEGKFFTSQTNYIKVKFGEAAGRVITSNDSIIKCLVPANIERYDPSVSVEVYGKSAVYNDFILLAPVIEQISENTASLGDTLTIYGKNFDFENSRNKIYIEDSEIRILNSARESIRFILPEKVAKSIIDLKLITQLQETAFTEAVTVIKPVLTSLPSVFRAYETIEITGSNFSIVREANKIYFDQNLAEVLEATRTKLKVRVPIGPYMDRSPKLRLELMDYTLPYEGDISLSDTWLLKSQLNLSSTFRGSKYFVHSNLGYIFEKQDENIRWKVHVMDPAKESWTHFYVSYPRPGIQVEDFSIIYNSGSGRVFFYFSGDEKNFYEFFPNSGSFSLKANYPGDARAIPATFSIENRLYLGLGFFENSMGYRDPTPLSNFWSYDINNDSWNQVASFPRQGRRMDLSVFVIDGIAYLGNGATDTGANDFWKYLPLSDEWVQLADAPDARTYTSFFEYDGKAYVYYGGNLTGNPDHTAFRYDPQINSWKLLEPVNDLYYTYFNYPDGTLALRFSNAVYLGISRHPLMEFFKADLSKL